MSSAGSLAQYSIRFANQQASSKGTGHFEVVSLPGTVSVNGLHLHIIFADSLGRVIGGHFMDA